MFFFQTKLFHQVANMNQKKPFFHFYKGDM